MYTFMKCLSWIICHIPEGCRRALGTFLGAFFWTFVPKKRKVLAQQQILDCGLTEDPDKAMAIARASTVRFGPMIVEVLSYPRYTKELLDEKITWHGKEYLDELKASGEGAVFMASHAGNWELLGAGLANYPIVSTFIHEDRPYHHVVEVLPPIKPYTADHKLSKEEKDRIMYETTQELNDRLEAHIRKYPEDWFWLHNRWKWTKRYKAKQAEKGTVS